MRTIEGLASLAWWFLVLYAFAGWVMANLKNAVTSMNADGNRWEAGAGVIATLIASAVVGISFGLYVLTEAQMDRKPVSALYAYFAAAVGAFGGMKFMEFAVDIAKGSWSVSPTGEATPPATRSRHAVLTFESGPPRAGLLLFGAPTMITPAVLRAIIPAAKQADIDRFAAPLEDAASEFRIDTPQRLSMFLPQVAHESGALASVSENLNYKPAAILATFNTKKIQRFTPEQAELYGRTADHPANQEMIANIAYANRMGNGDVASEAGWRTRGAGLIQTTGTDNQRAVAEHFGIPFEAIGDWLRTPEGAARSAGYFWHSNNLNALADAGDFIGVCAVTNTGNRRTQPDRIKGYPERLEFWERAKKVLGA